MVLTVTLDTGKSGDKFRFFLRFVQDPGGKPCFSDIRRRSVIKL
jgi:hypothetical protein